MRLLTLPTTKTKRQLDPHRLVGVVYGSEGVGKSTFASRFKDPLFINLDKGLAGLETFEVMEGGKEIEKWDWDLFRQWVDFLTAPPDPKTGAVAHGFGTIVIDTLDRLKGLAEAEARRKYRVAELKGFVHYGHVNVMLRSALEQLTSGGFGVVCIAHEKTETVCASTGRVIKPMDKQGGETFHRFTPSAGSAYKAVAARADYIARAAIDLRTGRRVLECSPSATRIAKDRSGVLPEVLPLDYAAFLECFRSAYKADNSGDLDNEEQSTA